MYFKRQMTFTPDDLNVMVGNSLSKMQETLYESLSDSDSIVISKQVMYWRKANAIHNWFTEHTTETSEGSEVYQVTKSNMESLLSDIKVVLELSDIKVVLEEHRLSPDLQEKAEELIPAVSGFFFGDNGYEDDYYDSLQETKDFLEKELKFIEDFQETNDNDYVELSYKYTFWY